ncbi:MAG: hypothetical protein A2X28_09645 [Elusimicrobia bacterium GWA2_56_46]|nr:MAG: hypothetical protein A2X28_09645 [Elusimicrobia bacterium GWA2_56_46]OGR54077.1 MAG: hypothetical protein A2X39_03250 [Elusimicrobia bacterium GWC2_56_31]HBB66472.1 hypothetical protein [Elusimicrobiota bacterium]HBW22980.1 hypothetical protein [Elusimicrobiota bacterium]
MKLKNILMLGLPAIALWVVAIFVLGIFLIKWFWMWTIPDLFPGAVASGLVAARISWWTALKLAGLVALLAAITNISKTDKV